MQAGAGRELVEFVRRFQTPIVANGRVIAPGEDQLVTFTP